MSHKKIERKKELDRQRRRREKTNRGDGRTSQCLTGTGINALSDGNPYGGRVILPLTFTLYGSIRESPLLQCLGNLLPDPFDLQVNKMKGWGCHRVVHTSL